MTTFILQIGWFAIAESSEVRRNQAISVDCLGENFVVFRSEDGEVFVLDAYCSHMGANLGFGGLVKKNCIECPFHQWKFDGRDGSVVDIPYSKNIDDWKDKGTITNFDSLKRHFKLFDSISCKKWED